MQLSEAWLREWIDPPWDSVELAQRLTMAGFEVEGRTPAASAFSGVVVGQIVESGKHPKADKLSVCSVTTDGRDRLQIVCGASNARAGLKSAVAVVGAKLPGDMTIQRTRLRDVESQGMLCSARELGLGEEAEGILELPDDCKLGTDLRRALGLEDTILALNLTPNRGDTLSVRGIAREVTALLGRRLKEKQQKAPVARGTDALSRQVVCTAGVPQVRRACDSRRERARAVTLVVTRTPQAQRPASDQPDRRRHQLRDARAGHAHACLRSRQAAAGHRRADGPARGAHQAARRHRRRSARARSRHCGCRRRGWSRRRHGWRAHIGHHLDDRPVAGDRLLLACAHPRERQTPCTDHRCGPAV